MFWWLLSLIAVCIGIYAAFIIWLLRTGRRETAAALATFLPDCVILLRRLLADHRTQRRSKLLIGGLLLYLASPIDLVPDFIPIIGQLDDLIVLALVLRTVLRAAGPDLLKQHWPGPTASLNAIMRLG